MMHYPQSLEASQKREPKLIIAAVANFRGVSAHELISPTKAQRLVWPRHEVSLMLREFTTLSWAAMGDLMGGRDHSTALNSYNRASGRMLQDRDYADQMMRLKAFVAAYDGPATQPSQLLATARKAMANTASPDQVTALAVTVLSMASVLADPYLTDAEARQACMAMAQVSGGAA